MLDPLIINDYYFLWTLGQIPKYYLLTGLEKEASMRNT